MLLQGDMSTEPRAALSRERSSVVPPAAAAASQAGFYRLMPTDCGGSISHSSITQL